MRPIVPFIAMLTTAAGCAMIKGSPAPDSGFLPHGDKLQPIAERSPFHGTWFADREKFYAMKKDYRKLYIAPIDTKFLEVKIRTQGEGESERWRVERTEDLHEIARYMEIRFKSAVQEYPNNPVILTNEIDDQTLVLESALVELNPTNPGINTIGTAAGFLVPGGGLLKIAGTGSVAFESIIRDGKTGEPLVEFKDRQRDKPSPISIKDYQQYAHARSIIDDWAKIFAELAATPYEHKVQEPLPFNISPL